MTFRMLNLSSKAQFFILTTVIIVGIFYALSKYINPYAFIDTSRAAEGGETFFFDNVKDKAVKTVEISSPSNLNSNLKTYKDFVENMASDKGYNMVFNYTVNITIVDFYMILNSEKYTLRANFTVPRP